MTTARGATELCEALGRHEYPVCTRELLTFAIKPLRLSGD